MTTGADDRVSRYGAAYRAEYGFEAKQVAARRRLLGRTIAAVRPSTVVETGCGWEMLAESVGESGPEVGQWVVIEPDAAFAAHARQAAVRLPWLTVVEGITEEVVGEVLRLTAGGADMLICSSLLHEVRDPAALLASCRRLLQRRSGLLHVNVPNARSLHRRLARAAGLIAAETELSARNVTLQQPRVYDLQGLSAAVLDAGFEVLEHGGYMLKPFTHAQMERCDFLTDDLIWGLFALGEELPELASEIFVNARPVGVA